MRTTIRLDDALLAEAKRLAMESGQTLTSLMEDALRARLAMRANASKRKRVRLTTVDGRGASGLDLDDSASLLEHMERE